jgi:hypothetical protein
LKRLALPLNPGGFFVVTSAEAERSKERLELIRRDFAVLEDRPFSGSKRQMIVFRDYSD